MFMIWDSSHENLQLFDWVSNTASYGFISLYVNPPSYSYDRAFFLNLTFKIQGQSHSSRSHNRNNILSTHIPLVPCQSALPFPRYSIFKIWPWKSKVKVIAQGHKVGITPYQLISLLFHVDRPCHSWDTAISKFDVENSRSRSWVRSKLKVITWVLHSVDSHPFRFMWIGHPFLSYDFFKIWPWKSRVKVMGEVIVQNHKVGLTSYRLTSLSFHVNLASHCWVKTFQNLTLKFKGQGHGWGHSSKSQCGSNILSTHIPFVPCQSALPFLTYSIIKIWPSKSRVKVMGEVTIQSHNEGLTSYRLTSLLFHVNRPSHSWVMTFFKIWPWNSKVKVMGEVTVQSHNVGLTSYRFTSLLFHVNWPSHSWNTASSQFDLENQGSRSYDPDVAQLQV